MRTLLIGGPPQLDGSSTDCAALREIVLTGNRPYEEHRYHLERYREGQYEYWLYRHEGTEPNSLMIRLMNAYAAYHQPGEDFQAEAAASVPVDY